MTDREAMQKSLAVHELYAGQHGWPDDIGEAIITLRERLAQPIIKNYLGKDNSAQTQRTHWEGCEEVHPECRKPKQEPVAWMNGWGDLFKNPDDAERGQTLTPLYTASQH